MKNIILFIGLGLLLSGCEATDPDIYKCLEKEYTKYDKEGKYEYKYDKSRFYFFMVIDKKQKTVSRLSKEGTQLPFTPREVYYTEEDNFIKAEEIVEPIILKPYQEGRLPYTEYQKNGIFREIRLDKISGTLYITEYNGITNDNPKWRKSKYQCERTEPVIR